MRVKLALVAAMPPLALAAQHTMPPASPLEAIPLLTWFFIVLFATFGWVASDVDKVAELWPMEGATRRDVVLGRLKLFKSIIGSETAGIFTYFGGKVAPGPVSAAVGLQFQDGRTPELHEFTLLLLVFGGGFLGSRLFERLFGKR